MEYKCELLYFVCLSLCLSQSSILNWKIVILLIEIDKIILLRFNEDRILKTLSFNFVFSKLHYFNNKNCYLSINAGFSEY